MKLGLHQSARLEQRLLQSPQMIQAMQILQLPGLALEERIEQELTENPFLEVVDPAAADAEEDGQPPPAPAAEEKSEEGVEAMVELLERYERDYGDGRSLQPAVSGDDRDRKYEAMQNAPAPSANLAEAVLGQLVLLPLSDQDRELIEYLAWSLDERGYLPVDREELAGDLTRRFGRKVEVDEIEAALADLRDSTHPALGARDLREALLLELDARGFEGQLVRTLVCNHLEDIEANRLPRIAKVTDRSIEEVKEAIEVIRTLDPTPGAGYGEMPGERIVPDVIVEEVEGEHVVRLERERVRELSISPSYRLFLQQAERGDGVREWVKKRLESARWFIEALEQRESTLLRIARSIFARQSGFLQRGPEGLEPLRMQEVADELGIHISTVSRGVSGKHAQTPRGIFPLKYFFTGGTAKTSGEIASQVSIKEHIKEVVAREDPANPLSDEQIAAILGEKQGIQIARRTVTKYRKALSLPSSSQRRAY